MPECHSQLLIALKLVMPFFLLGSKYWYQASQWLKIVFLTVFMLIIAFVGSYHIALQVQGLEIRFMPNLPFHTRCCSKCLVL